jgi:hypothetical protein
MLAIHACHPWRGCGIHAILDRGRDRQQEEASMRISAFVVLGLVTAAMPRPAAAAYNYPWCAQYYDRSGIFACSFATREQCMATISGIGGNCIQNAGTLPPYAPYAAYYEPRPAKHRHHAKPH